MPSPRTGILPMRFGVSRPCAQDHRERHSHRPGDHTADRIAWSSPLTTSVLARLKVSALSRAVRFLRSGLLEIRPQHPAASPIPGLNLAARRAGHGSDRPADHRVRRIPVPSESGEFVSRCAQPAAAAQQAVALACRRGERHSTGVHMLRDAEPALLLSHQGATAHSL